MASYISIGHEITTTKYYSVALGTLVFYDYLLTLQDEVQYAWGGRKSWVFYLFLINRYVTIIYDIWALVAFNYPGYTGNICQKTVIVQPTFLVFATFLAQVFFVAQTYALSKRNHKVLAVFTLLTVIQLALGIIYLTEPGTTSLALPSIPLDAFQICILDSQNAFSIRVAYIVFSLVYNTVSFLTILRLSYSTCGPRSTWPVILKTITKDSLLYFLVVLVSHSLVVSLMALNLSRMEHNSFAVVNVFVPIMVSRLVLNLRKSSDQRTNTQLEWTLRSLSFAPNHELSVCTQFYHQTSFPVSDSDTRGMSTLSSVL